MDEIGQIIIKNVEADEKVLGGAAEPVTDGKKEKHGQKPGDQPDNDAGYHERPPDVIFARAHQLHDRNFLARNINSQTHCVESDNN